MLLVFIYIFKYFLFLDFQFLILLCFSNIMYLKIFIILIHFNTFGLANYNSK